MEGERVTEGEEGRGREGGIDKGIEGGRVEVIVEVRAKARARLREGELFTWIDLASF